MSAIPESVKEGFRALALAACALVASAVRGEVDSVLFWMVTDLKDPSSGLSEWDLRYLQEPDGQGGGGAFARIAVLDGDGGRLSRDGVDVYLDVWAEGGGASPDGVYLPSVDEAGNYVWESAKPTFADLSGYADADASYRFLIEIGLYDENDDWLVLAIAENSATYQQLVERGHVSNSTLNAPEHGEWTGGVGYVVPEPSSGLLLLVGAGLLSLRRRRWAV